MRFPTNELTLWQQKVERALLWSLVVLVPAVIAVPLMRVYAAGPLVVTAESVFAGFLPVAGYAFGAAMFARTYSRADSTARPRIRWVIVGFLIGYAGLILAYGLEIVGVQAWPIWFNDSLQTLGIAAPVAVSYAIVRHRVIDVRFYLNRALVYGLLTTIAVGVLALLDWIVSKQLEGFHFGIAVEVAGALAIGFSMQRIHGWLDRVVDRYVFRSVHDAEQRLDRAGASLMYAHSIEGLDRLVCVEPADALRIASASIFHRDEGDAYRRTAFAGADPGLAVFDCDNRAILEMCAARRPVAVGDFTAFPFAIRNAILGFALYGVHRNGSILDPNERAVLEAFASRAAVAYDHLTSKAREIDNARLRVENETLRSLVVPR